MGCWKFEIFCSFNYGLAGAFYQAPGYLGESWLLGLRGGSGKLSMGTGRNAGLAEFKTASL